MMYLFFLVTSALLLLIYLLLDYRERRAWQAHYDAVERTAWEIARSRAQPFSVRAR